MKTFVQIAAGVLCVLACGALGLGAAAYAQTSPETQIKHAKLIKVSAHRFAFEPKNITLKKGETVDLELTSTDVLMGFSVPEMKARSDIPPGQVTHLTLTPDKLGTFAFKCSNFCGIGHWAMDGTITVVE